MLETPETITYVLDTVGETLTFSGFTIKGIPGTLVYNVQNFESPYDIEKQDITFQIAHADYFTNSLVRGMEFTYVLLGKTYTFTTIDFIDDLTGWVEMKVTLTNRV